VPGVGRDSIKVEASQWGKTPIIEDVYYYLSQDFLFIYLHLDYSDPTLSKWPEVSPQGFRGDEVPPYWTLYLHPIYPSGRTGTGLTEVRIIPQGLERFLGSDKMFVYQDSYTILLVILATEHEQKMDELLVQSPLEVKKERWKRR